MKTLGFLLSPLLGCMLLACAVIAHWLSWPPISIGLSSLVLLYGIMPLADHWIGEDRQNFREDHRQRWLNGLPPAMLGAQLVHLSTLIVLLGTSPAWHWWTLIPAAGVISSITAINAAHELIHRPVPWQRQIGSILLASVAYPGFKVEHVRGHHRWVATEHDPSSAPAGMSLYRFLPRAVWRNTINAFVLADRRWQGLATWQRILLNETLRGWALTAIVASLIGAIGGGGVVLAWAAHSLVAILTLETINYVEHYGLRRNHRDDGSFEPVTIQHSWNCSRRLSNWLLLGLQRHSDHHAHAGRPFAELRHVEQAPQLPAGYASMMLLALVPPLWFRVMHPRLPGRPHPNRPPAHARQ